MRILIFVLFVAVFTSCNTLDIYEKDTSFSKHEWKSSDTPSFTFDIKDTSSFYNMYVVIRHEDAYRYQNIWLNVQIKSPDTSYTVKKEFALADNAKWLGSAMDDIIEHRIAINAVPLTLHKGSYTFTLQQVMREDPLQHVLNAGIRVEKAHP